MNLNTHNSYATAACTALLCYDFLLCLHSELPLIWAQRPSKVTLFYYLCRYAIPAYLIVGWVPTLNNGACLQWCTPVSYGQHVLEIIFTPAVAVITFVKVYPTSHGNPLWTIVVVALSVVPLCTSIYVYAMDTPKVISPSNLGHTLACVGTSSLSDQYILKMLVVSRACAIASDILVVATIVFYTRGRWALAGDLDKRLPTLRVLIQRDGFVMFLFLALLDSIDLTENLTTPKGHILTTFINPAASIIFSRATLRFLAATGRAGPLEDTEELATHPMSFVPRTRSGAGSSGPFGSGQAESIMLTVMSAVIPETGDEGRVEPEDGVEELDSPQARSGEDA